MLRYFLLFLALTQLALLCYLVGPTVPAESHELKQAARERQAALASLPEARNGYALLAFIPRPGNPEERQAIYNLSRHHPSQETPPETGLEQALTAFRRSRPLFDRALERPAFLYPERAGNAVEGLTMASWLALAYLVDAEHREDAQEQMWASLKAWRLGVLTVRNQSLPTLGTGMAMSWLALESLRPLVANGKLSRSGLLQLQDFLEQNRLEPSALVRAADAEAAYFGRMAPSLPLRGAGAWLPGVLGAAYRSREIKVYDVCYLRVRPCLTDLEPFHKRGIDLFRTLAIMERNGDRMAAEAFPDLETSLLSYRLLLDRQDELRAAVALQLAYTPAAGYPGLGALSLRFSPRLSWQKNRLILDGQDYPGLRPEELELRLKPATSSPRPQAGRGERAWPDS